MTNFVHENKYVSRFVFIPMIFVIYAIYYDLSILKVYPAKSYIALKLFFIFFPVICYYTSLIKKEFRELFLAAFWIFYCFYHVRFISIAYHLAFVQVAVAFSIMAALKKWEYLFFSISMLIASSYSILFSARDMLYVAPGMTSKPETLINSICLQGLCFLVYYYITLPKLKITESEKKLANYGKASSFIMHELAKPIDRMIHNPNNLSQEINVIKDILNLSNSINHSAEKLEERIIVNNLVNQHLEKYQEYISDYEIKINLHDHGQKIELLSEEKSLNFIIDNLIKNAIEEVKDFENINKRVIKISIERNSLTIENNIKNSSIINQVEIVAFKSAKDGHMGVGLFLSELLANRIKCSLKISKISEKFVATLIF